MLLGDSFAHYSHSSEPVKSNVILLRGILKVCFIIIAADLTLLFQSSKKQYLYLVKVGVFRKL